jgi:hypothetical protein
MWSFHLEIFRFRFGTPYRPGRLTLLQMWSFRLEIFRFRFLFSHNRKRELVNRKRPKQFDINRLLCFLDQLKVNHGFKHWRLFVLRNKCFAPFQTHMGVRIPNIVRDSLLLAGLQCRYNFPVIHPVAVIFTQDNLCRWNYLVETGESVEQDMNIGLSNFVANNLTGHW